MSVYPRSKGNEIVGILLFALSILLFLSLFSYQSTDPSLSVSATHQKYQNIIGKSGAWVADFLFQLFGLAAILLPLPLLFIGYRKLRVRSFDYPYIKALGFFFTLLATASGFTLLSPTLPDWANFAPGGVVGILLSQNLLGYFNRAGTSDHSRYHFGSLSHPDDEVFDRRLVELGFRLSLESLLRDRQSSPSLEAATQEQTRTFPPQE